MVGVMFNSEGGYGWIGLDSNNGILFVVRPPRWFACWLAKIMTDGCHCLDHHARAFRRIAKSKIMQNLTPKGYPVTLVLESRFPKGLCD